MIALLAITWAVFAFVDRYDVIEPQILLNTDFENGLADWTVNGGQDRLQVRAGNIAINGLGTGHTVGVRQTVLRPRGADILRMNASVRHAGVTKGSRPWHAMRLLVVQRDAKGTSLWELPHEVAKENGDGPWRRVSVIFALSSQVKSVEIAAVLNQVGGTMNVRDMALAVVSEKAVFPLPSLSVERRLGPASVLGGLVPFWDRCLEPCRDQHLEWYPFRRRTGRTYVGRGPGRDYTVRCPGTAHSEIGTMRDRNGGNIVCEHNE